MSLASVPTKLTNDMDLGLDCIFYYYLIPTRACSYCLEGYEFSFQNKYTSTDYYASDELTYELCDAYLIISRVMVREGGHDWNK